jgi:hypothetical protein
VQPISTVSDTATVSDEGRFNSDFDQMALFNHFQSDKTFFLFPRAVLLIAGYS